MVWHDHNSCKRIVKPKGTWSLSSIFRGVTLLLYASEINMKKIMLSPGISHLYGIKFRRLKLLEEVLNHRWSNVSIDKYRAVQFWTSIIYLPCYPYSFQIFRTHTTKIIIRWWLHSHLIVYGNNPPPSHHVAIVIDDFDDGYDRRWVGGFLTISFRHGRMDELIQKISSSKTWNNIANILYIFLFCFFLAKLNCMQTTSKNYI